MNREAYDAIAPQWDAARTRLSAPEERLLQCLLAGMLPTAQVLDLGCGSGRPIAQHVLDSGFAVTGVDQSTNLLALARSRLPAGTWIESSLEDYEPAHRFDAVIAWDSLFHLPRREHIPIFRKVRAALEPGACFLLTAGGSEHPAFTDEMFGQRFFYDSHAPDQTVALLADAGFIVEIMEFLNPPTSGRDKGRIALLVKAA